MTLPTADFLARLADDRRRRVEAMKIQIPGYRLRERLGTVPPAGRLERALRRGALANPLKIVGEILRALPSKGVLRADVDAPGIARLCERDAAAISIVTEPDHFQGELAWVDAVRRVTRMPILVRDVIVDEYQMLDAALRGADGVLLIAALCSEVQLQILVGKARLLGLDPMVEVQDVAGLQRALRAGATLITIDDWNPDTSGTERDAAFALLAAVPPLVSVVADSAASAPGGIARLRGTRCDAVLVGEELMASRDPAATLAGLAAAARG